MKQITWSEGRFGGQVGKISKAELFSISYTTSREDIAAGTPWVLRHHLPVARRDQKFKDVAEAHEWAQNFLESFVRWLGAKP